MRAPVILALVSGAALAACAGQAPPPRDPELCQQIFDAYDDAVWLYPQQYQLNDYGLTTQQPDIARPAQRLRENGCLTSSDDLADLTSLAARLQPYRIENSGAGLRPTAISAGIVTGFSEQFRASEFFRSLGYRTRSVGEPTLGRRILIGPFVTQGAVDQAIATAREAGFIAPHVAEHTKF
jgi:hypothetical protein